MSGITNPNILPAPVQEWFDDVLLAREEPYLINNTFAMKKSMSANSGNTVVYRRYNNLARATVPLGPSGLTPPPQTLSALDIKAEMDSYGTYVIITDQVTLYNQDPVLNEAASLLAQSYKETDDELTRNSLEATSAFINSTHGVNGDFPTELTREDINEAIFTLIGNSARMISDFIEGQDRAGTAPIRESYWVNAHSDVLGDLEQVQGFISTAQYPSNMNVLTAEWGSVANTRWRYSPLGSITENASALGADVYNCFHIGREAYATIRQERGSAKFLYQGMGSGNDPLFQRQTAGYKFFTVPKLLNDKWLLNVRATLS